jgi:hypothetical protein
MGFVVAQARPGPRDRPWRAGAPTIPAPATEYFKNFRLDIFFAINNTSFKVPLIEP